MNIDLYKINHNYWFCNNFAKKAIKVNPYPEKKQACLIRLFLLRFNIGGRVHYSVIITNENKYTNGPPTNYLMVVYFEYFNKLKQQQYGNMK